MPHKSPIARPDLIPATRRSDNGSPNWRVLFAFVCLTLSLFINVDAQSGPLSWTPQSSGVTVRLRGASAVNDRVAWASGDKGTFLRTIDGGKTWTSGVVAGAEALDFRDVDAFSADVAYLLSIGEGDKSRIYKTVDGGRTWALQMSNTNPKAFFDAMAFWDSNRGLAMSDPVNGKFIVVRTTDGGKSWLSVPPANLPSAIDGEGGFAASGTCIAVAGSDHAWFATGGPKARVFRSIDGGNNWLVSETPIAGGDATGIFSILFLDKQKGVVVGGNYTKEAEANSNLAVSADGGVTWKAASGLGGYRSAVARIPGTTRLIAVGPSGADYSTDAGATWSQAGTEGFHAISLSKTAGWAVGEKGKIARITWSR
jgi:photosystem II stability/assembly factor-like uncharacterized protein